MSAVMFLGGPLDHTVREVDVSEDIAGMPARATYRVPTTGERYVRHQVATGGARWWIYILEGYDPPRQHVIHTMPAWAVQKI